MAAGPATSVELRRPSPGIAERTQLLQEHLQAHVASDEAKAGYIWSCDSTSAQVQLRREGVLERMFDWSTAMAFVAASKLTLTVSSR